LYNKVLGVSLMQSHIQQQFFREDVGVQTENVDSLCRAFSWIQITVKSAASGQSVRKNYRILLVAA
jgi:hypothetical protein